MSAPADASLEALKKVFDALDVGLLLVRLVQPDDVGSFICEYANDAGARSSGRARGS